MALLPCPTCERHVKASESVCPFCQGGIDSHLADEAMAAPLRIGARAVLLFGAGVFALGCSPRGQATIYGGPPPPVPSASATAPGTAVPSATTTATAPTPTAPVAIYGAPPPSDPSAHPIPKGR